MKRILAFALSSFLLGAACAAPLHFSVKPRTDKASQLFTVESVTAVESFSGKSSDISGEIVFDPKKQTGSGSLKVRVSTIDTGIAGRNEHMLAANMLDAAQFPFAVFKSNSAKKLSQDRFQVSGSFTLHGITKPLQAVVTLKYVKGSDKTRALGLSGDVIFVTTKFKVLLKDFAIDPVPAGHGGVAEEVSISLSAFGTTS